MRQQFIVRKDLSPWCRTGRVIETDDDGFVSLKDPPHFVKFGSYTQDWIDAGFIEPIEWPSKPDAEWLKEEGYELDGDEPRVPTEDEFCYWRKFSNDYPEIRQAVNENCSQTCFNGLRWIVRKIEPKYRPWTAEEAIGKTIKNGTFGGLWLIVGAREEFCFMSCSRTVEEYRLTSILSSWTQPDGSPCGVLIKD